MPPSTTAAQVEDNSRFASVARLGATWTLRVLFVVAGPTVAAAISAILENASDPVRLTAAVLWWTAWGAGLLAVLVPGAIGLTVIRIITPVAAILGVWATIDDPADGAPALVAGGLAVLVAMTWRLGEEFVDQSSYGPEERLLLKPPGVVWLGPLPLAWLAVVVGVIAGPLLLAARAWIPGAIAVVVGLPLAAIAAQALLRLATRWMVLVPGGVVLHDRMAVLDPVLFRRDMVAAAGPAFDDTRATDLTMAALGTPVQIDFRSAVEMIPVTVRTTALSVERVSAVLISPTRPGRFLDRLNAHLGR